MERERHEIEMRDLKSNLQDQSLRSRIGSLEDDDEPVRVTIEQQKVIKFKCINSSLQLFNGRKNRIEQCLICKVNFPVN